MTTSFKRWLPMVAVALLAAPSTDAGAASMGFGQRWYVDGVRHTAFISKAYEDFSITGPDICYCGQDWCIRTSQNRDVGHYHFTQDFTTEERDRAELWCREFYSDSQYIIGDTVALPTTAYNCHAYALTSRRDIWVLDQSKVLADDFSQCYLGPQVGDVMEHTNDHSSVVSLLVQMPAPVVARVKSKWAGYGAYESYRYIYGDAIARYRHN